MLNQTLFCEYPFLHLRSMTYFRNSKIFSIVNTVSRKFSDTLLYANKNYFFSLRTAIVDLYGEYSRVSKAYFVSIWRDAMSPLLAPPEQPLLTQSSCIYPIPRVFSNTRGKNLKNSSHSRRNLLFSYFLDLFDARLNYQVEEEIPKKAGVQQQPC